MPRKHVYRDNYWSKWLIAMWHLKTAVYCDSMSGKSPQNFRYITDCVANLPHLNIGRRIGGKRKEG